MIKDSNQFAIGDWVKGESKDGELLLGYVENIDLKGRVKVTVTASDNENSVGKTLNMFKKVEKLPISNVKTEEEIMSLIDLALQIRDQKWFMKLTEQLKLTKHRSHQNLEVTKGKVRNKNKRNFCSAE